MNGCCVVIINWVTLPGLSDCILLSICWRFHCNNAWHDDEGVARQPRGVERRWSKVKVYTENNVDQSLLEKLSAICDEQSKNLLVIASSMIQKYLNSYLDCNWVNLHDLLFTFHCNEAWNDDERVAGSQLHHDGDERWKEKVFQQVQVPSTQLDSHSSTFHLIRLFFNNENVIKSQLMDWSAAP